MPKSKESSSTAAVEASLLELLNADETLVRKALTSGNDFGEFSAEVQNRLTDAHKSAVQDCIQNADKISQLHDQILACDQVFERLEKMLLGFQDDLGSISGDMKRLQDQSLHINQELENRKLIGKELSQFVDDILVSEGMIKIIMDGDVNDRSFLEQLHELQHKINFLKSQEFKEAKCLYDVQPVIESLKFKAIEKIREWTLTKIYLFRKPLSNYQIPQHQMLKSRFFYEFLLANERNVAKEVQEEYVDTIGKMFFSYFKAYVSRLFKLMMVDAASKDDLLGMEDVVKSTGISSFFGAKPQVRNRATVFSLGDRQNLLSHDFLAPLIVPHVAQESNEKFQFEALFRSIHFAFVDHCSHEFLFLSDFFMLHGQVAVDLHTRIMSRAVALLYRSFDEKIALNFDVISLYLCICLCDKFRALLIERQVPSMDNYWQTVSNLLWIRVDKLMRQHNDSIRNIDVKKMQSATDTRPHYIIRRYAELTCAFLVVTESCGKEVDKRLEALLESCEDGVEQLLARMATTLPTQKQRLIFLINNYDLILNIIDERVMKENRIHSIVHELNEKAINEFVEVTLTPAFSSLISFVNECEQLVQQGHHHLLVRYNDKLADLILAFSNTWKRAIEEVNSEIVKSFTNFKNGTSILQSAFSQFVQYVQRFAKLLTHEVFRDNPSVHSMTNLASIYVELKKYKPVY